MNSAKPFKFSKQEIWEAWLKVKRNKGGSGVDQETIASFEADIKNNLFQIWNRMSSGSYFPPEVKGVEIPKKSGGSRLLGIPTIGDRVAQMVVKQRLERILEPVFHRDSFGYRPGRSAHDAIELTRRRCWKKAWIVEFDIKGLFDNIDHNLLLKALYHHCDDKPSLLYVKRWLTTPVLQGGRQITRRKGTPQGGVISPILANLFLHYAFDMWMVRNFPQIEFCRYADDGVIHCRTKSEATFVLNELTKRLTEVKLDIHPQKSSIVFCRMNGRWAKHDKVSFEFLGFCFKPRIIRLKNGRRFLGFVPGASQIALLNIRKQMRSWKVHYRSSQDLETIAARVNPIIRGWYQYYGKFHKTSLRPTLNFFNYLLAKWIRRKYKKFRSRYVRSLEFLGKIAQTKPNLFYHWQINCKPTACQ